MTLFYTVKKNNCHNKRSRDDQVNVIYKIDDHVSNIQYVQACM